MPALSLCFFLGAALWVPVARAQSAPAVEAAVELRFRDLFVLPAGRAGLELSGKARALHDHRVRLTGYMVAQEELPSGRFFLTPLPLRMSEHADGAADDLPANTVVVIMPPQDSARPLPHTPGLLQLTGLLQVGRHELDDGRVAWVRLLLDPPAAQAVASR